MVGSAGSGKSTVFTALTHTTGAHGRATQAVTPVPDPRLEVLAGLEGAQRVVPARVRFTDVPASFTAQGLGKLREMDVLCVVLRAFGPGADPVMDLSSVSDELLLADLALAESALENLRRAMKGRGPKSLDASMDLLARAQGLLVEGGTLTELDLSIEERRSLAGLGFLSIKPWVPVANLGEGDDPPEGLPGGTVGLWAEIEAETAGMAPAEAAALLREFGVNQPGLDLVVEACYRGLDLVTFFTYNEEEAHAWEVRRGATAPEAAGVIHSDLQRGFIRAEVIGLGELVAAGGWDEAKAKGALRVEGKDYVVGEGDVIHVRFAV